MKYIELLNKALEEVEADLSYSIFLPIAKRKSEEELFHFNKKKGITFTFDLETNKLKQIDFFSKEYQGYQEYTRELPKNLRFDMGKSEVNQILMDSLLTEVCTIENSEFIDLYPVPETVAFDAFDKLILEEKLTAKGFTVTDWGRGNW